MKIKWIITQDTHQIFFPMNFHKQLTSLEKVNFHFGSWNRELSVQVSEDLTSDTIGLSIDLINKIFIPDDLTYELSISENNVSLGPVILYLVTKRLIHQLDKLKNRMENILPLNGLIIVSTISGINTKKQTINGYYFQPGSETKESTWQAGTFQYPGAIFKRASIPSKINKHLYDSLNGRVFNSTYFDKWDMWKWLAPNKSIRNHLPYTQQLHTIDDIKDMVDIYQSIYLKPKNGSKGKGIIQVRYEDNKFYITNDKNRVRKVKRIDDHPIINSILKKKKKYLIQQGVPVKHDSRNIDFRIYMQKNEKKEWKCTQLIARFAKPGSITTNLRYLDYLLLGKEALEHLYQLDKIEVEVLEEKIISICQNACELLDQNGSYGDIAIDFILDNDFHVWILEMNKRYGYKSFSILQDPRLYSQIIRNPFLYASTIAGFNRESIKQTPKEGRD